MVPSYRLSIEIPTPLVLGVGVKSAPWTLHVTFVLIGQWRSGNSLLRSVLIKIARRLLALQALFHLRRWLLPARKLLREFRALGLLLFLLPALQVGRGNRRGLRGHLVLCLGGLPPLPLDLGPARGVVVPLGSRLVRAGMLPLLLLLQERAKWELPARSRLPLPAPLPRLSLPIPHRTFNDVRNRGRLRSLAPACYPPVVPDLRIEEHGRIREPGHERVAPVDVAVVLAVSPLPVRGQKVKSVDSGHRPGRSLLVPAPAVTGRGLLTATGRGVEALGRDVTGLDPLIDTGLAVTALGVTALGVTGRGLLTTTGRAVSERVPLPAGEIGVTACGHTLSRVAGHTGDYLARQETQEGVEAVASQPPAFSEAVVAVTPVARGAALTALPSAVQDLARFFLSLSGSSSLGAIGGIAGVTASAAGSGGAVCPPTDAGGAVITCTTAVTPAGAGVSPLLPLLFLVCLESNSERWNPAHAGCRSRSSSDRTDRRAKKRARRRSPSPGPSSRRWGRHYRSSLDSSEEDRANASPPRSGRVHGGAPGGASSSRAYDR